MWFKRSQPAGGGSTESIPSSSEPETETEATKTLRDARTDDEPERLKHTGDTTFDNAEGVRFYKPMPKYEGLHRWDPKFEWKPEEEKKLVKKVFGLKIEIGRNESRH
jgi:hypothetical protein